MADELSELDQLIESDVLEALGEKIPEDSSVEIDGITIEDIEPQVQENESNEDSIEDETIQEEITADETISEDNIVIEDIEEPTEDNQEQEIENNQEVTVNTTDLASLLSQLLNNKTIEITIKIKD